MGVARADAKEISTHAVVSVLHEKKICHSDWQSQVVSHGFDV